MYKEETDTVKYAVWAAQAFATAILVVAKLVGAINWAWWVVISPIWLPYVLAAVVFFCLFVISIGVLIAEGLNHKHPRI